MPVLLLKSHFCILIIIIIQNYKYFGIWYRGVVPEDSTEVSP